MVRIYPANARFYLSSDPMGSGQIRSPDTSPKAILAMICQTNTFGLVLPRKGWMAWL